jgi:transposase
MSGKLSLEERIQVILLYAKFESSDQVQKEWRKQIGTQPPSKPTILDLVAKFKETGSVNDRERTGRPRTAVTVEAVESVTEQLTIYFFDGSVTGESYLEMLQTYVWPKVRQRRLYFQQDGAPSHYSLVVREWLDQKFPDHWIGRRGPIEWPARSPDLTPPDFFLWGYLKNIVYMDKPSTLAELRSRIEQACAELQPSMCNKACKSVADRLKLCITAEGAHFENFL